MTKAEIMDVLEKKAVPYSSFAIDENTAKAMVALPNPFDLVAPILELIGTHPTVDFGMPGDLVHFVEHFYSHGYEELLMASVAHTPTAHNIWMLHRCYNNPRDAKRKQYKALINQLMASDDTSESVKQEIQSYTWE